MPETFRPTALRLVAGCLLVLGQAGAAAQQTVYRCGAADGRVIYQADPCPEPARQREVRLPATPPVAADARGPTWNYQAARHASITFFYDPAHAPADVPPRRMEAMIQSAMALWTRGCRVDLNYGGQAAYRAPGSPERVPIRWQPELARMAHPAHAGTGIAGTGSMTAGISLSPRGLREDALFSTLVHEMGHVLGLPHNHEDTRSVMSYLRDESTRSNPQPSQSDYVACSVSMKTLFGEYTPPGELPPERGPGMSDRQALEKKLGPGAR